MRRSTTGTLIAGLAGLVTLTSGCGLQSDDVKPRQSGLANVVLISVDTLRADHLGCYGYDRDTSPELDQLSRNAVVFEHAYAQAASTTMSHASMLTSLWPPHHGASVQSRLPGNILTLAEVLSQQGYDTASFNGGGQVGEEFGLDQGFTIYNSYTPDDTAQIAAAARSWIAKSAARPFFLFLHTYETHQPYTPTLSALRLFEQGYEGPLPEREISVELLASINAGKLAITDADLRHVRNAYDAEIHSVDAQLGQLLEFLKQEELYDDTLIVVTSDHGEEFGEHGMVGWHSHSLYDELLHVPLIIKLPGSRRAGERVSTDVRSIDIAPTILVALGLDPPPSFAGQPLAGPIAVALQPLPALSFTDGWGSQTSLRLFPWKFYDDQLYNLQADPEETTDVAPQNASIAGEYSLKRKQLIDSRPAPEPERFSLSKRLRDRLKSLGYIR